MPNPKKPNTPPSAKPVDGVSEEMGQPSELFAELDRQRRIARGYIEHPEYAQYGVDPEDVEALAHLDNLFESGE